MTVLSILKDIVDQARAPRSPVDSFDSALRRRERRYEELRRTTLSVLYMKNKLEADLAERRAEIARVYHAARTAARRGDDDMCLVLLGEKRALEGRLRIAEEGVHDARDNAQSARRALDDLKSELRELGRERLERRSAMDSFALRQQLHDAKYGPAALEEEARLDSARLHMDRIAAELEIERRMSAEEILDAELGEDCELRIELARLRAKRKAS